MYRSFAETHEPVQLAVDAPRSALPAVSGGGLEAERSLRLAREQIDHYKLWTSVAIGRNAIKASEAFPIVSRINRGGARQRLSNRQRQHLRQRYGSAIRCSVENLEPVGDGHPLVDLLNAVNSVDWWQNFAYESYLFYQLCGVCYWWVIPNKIRTEQSPNGLPAELWVIPPQWIKPKMSRRTGLQTGWTVTPDGDSRRSFDLPMDEVIFNQQKNPRSKTQPFSMVDASSSWVLNSEAIELANREAMRHGIISPLVMTFDRETYPEPPAQQILDRIGAKFMQRYGGAAKAGNLPALPPGVDVKAIGNKPRDMDFGASADRMRDNVLAAHGTPKSIAGLPDDYNKANIFGSNLIWTSHTITPLLTQFAGFMTEKLAKRFEPGLVVWFDDVTPLDAEEERREQELDFAMGAFTPEMRAMYRGHDLPEEPAAQKRFIKAGFAPLEDFNDGPGDRHATGAGDPGPEPAAPDGGDDAGGDLGDPAAGDPGADPGEANTDPRADSAKCSHGAPVGGVRFAATPRQKRIVRSFGLLHDSYERGVKPDLRDMWQGLLDKATERADNGETTAGRLMTPEEFKDAFNAACGPLWRATAMAGYAFEADVLGIDLDGDEQRQEFELPAVDLNEDAQAAIDRFVSAREGGVWDVVYQPVRAELAEAIAERLKAGSSLDEVKQAVADVLGAKRDDVTAIARTESTAGLNYGQQTLRDLHGIEKKEWMATFDKDTRPAHLDANAQIVNNGEPFTVDGEQLMHPGDGSRGASAGNIINCRCTSAGVVE